MLYKSFFGHGLIRKYIVTFGNLFQGMTAVRFNNDGTENHRVVVPIEYTKKEKWFVRTTMEPTLNETNAMIFPRFSFEMEGMSYDAGRKQPNNLKLKSPVSNNPSTRGFAFQPVPWNFNFNLYLTCKSPDEAAQLIEQILPIFTPDYAVKIALVPEINAHADIPLSLAGPPTYEDNYDGGLKEDRRIIWTLPFVMKGWLYGPVSQNGVILNANIRISDMIGNLIETLTVNELTVGVNEGAALDQKIAARDLALEDFGFGDYIVTPAPKPIVTDITDIDLSNLFDDNTNTLYPDITEGH